jgi:3-mercaptopyruvate sulfurtransferase SseA
LVLETFIPQRSLYVNIFMKLYTSARVAQKLMEMGHTKVYALKGGWREWFKANYPTEKK